MSNKSILVVGAGAIGGVCAAVLRQNGQDPVLVCKYETVAKTVRDSGLIYERQGQKTAVQMRAVAHPRELEGQSFDIILMATKATDMIEASQDCLPLMHPDSVLVSLQNGICEEALAEIVGQQRVIGCVVGWGATWHGPGHVEQTSAGEFVLGELDGQISTRLRELQSLLQPIVPVSLTENILAQLYSKLIVNACITSLGAVSGLYLGEMLNTRLARRLFIHIMEEAMLVAKGLNLEVPAYAGKLDYVQFVGSSGFFHRLQQHIMIWAIGRKYKNLKSSMLQSLERQKPTEIGFLNGYIVDKAQALGLQVPLNAAIVAMVKQIEGGKRPISAENLAELDAKTN